MLTTSLLSSANFGANGHGLAPMVHPERAQQVELINSKQGITWKAAAHERFAAFAPADTNSPLISLLGVKGDWKAAIEEGKKKGEIVDFVPKSNAAIPDTFDSETNWPQCGKMINDIRDQSACGCCWAFAGAEAGSDRMCIATNASMMVPLSAQDICFCGFFVGGCNGGQIDTPWSHIKSAGAVTGGQYQGSGPFGNGFCSDFSLPHCHHHGPQGQDPYPAEGTPGCPNAASPKCPKKCDANATGTHATWSEDKITFKGQVESAGGEAGIQQMIMEGGPVSTAFTVYEDFANYAGGVYSHTTGGALGGHAVKFVGWGVDAGVKYWKVANSWNPYWGEKGYFRIQRGENNCGIENGVVGSSADAQWGKKSVLDATTAA